METQQAIRTRRSIRKFTDKEIPISLIKQILWAGTRAPSGGNRQPWRFIVTTDPAKISQFDPHKHQPWVEKAPAVIVACADPHDTWAKYDEREDCYILDTAAAIQNMLLAIHDLGLGGVWILDFSQKAVRELLHIPKHWHIISIIPFGYPAPDAGRERSRKPLSEVAYLEDADHVFTD